MLLFAVENHAASIAGQIGGCRDLLLSVRWNTRDNHLTYWDNLIRPQVISIKDLLHQIIALDDTEAARMIAPDVAALERYTIAAIQLLSSARTGPDDPSYPTSLAAASQRAEQIVRLIETFWNSDAAPMDVEAPLQSEEPTNPLTLVQ